MSLIPIQASPVVTSRSEQIRSKSTTTGSPQKHFSESHLDTRRAQNHTEHLPVINITRTHRTAIVDVPSNHPYSLSNLPIGVAKPNNNNLVKEAIPNKVIIPIGDYVLDVNEAISKGYLKVSSSISNALKSGDLTDFMAAGKDAWDEFRSQVTDLLATDSSILTSSTKQAVLIPSRQFEAEFTMMNPAEIKGYTDFYAGIEHAWRLGKLIRPDGNPLLENYLHIPVGYDGAPGSVTVGQEVIRPVGQVRTPDGITTKPEPNLDYEIEAAMWVGPGNQMGHAISTADAGKHIFGFSLLNDSSARGLQFWEYQPLGPFLGKNFYTQISPFITMAAALEDVKESARLPIVVDQQPYLEVPGGRMIPNIGLLVEVEIPGADPLITGISNMNHLYWTPEQMLAHHTVNGCPVGQFGDRRGVNVMASGTISGPISRDLETNTVGGEASLVEATRRWQDPFTVQTEDGEVSFTSLPDGSITRMVSGAILRDPNGTDQVVTLGGHLASRVVSSHPITNPGRPVPVPADPSRLQIRGMHTSSRLASEKPNSADVILDRGQEFTTTDDLRILDAAENNEPRLIENGPGFHRLQMFPGVLHERWDTPRVRETRWGTIHQLVSGKGGFTPKEDPREVYLMRAGSPQSHGEAIESDHQPFKIPDGVAPSPTPMFFKAGELGKPGAFMEPGTVMPLYETGFLSVAQATIGAAQNTTYRSSAEIAYLPLRGAVLAQTEQGLARVTPQQVFIVPSMIAHSFQPEEPTDMLMVRNLNPNFSFVLPYGGPLGLSLLTQNHLVKTTSPWADFDSIANPKPMTEYREIDGTVFEVPLDRSPYNVLGFSGNHVPWHFDFNDFMQIVSANEGHAHPSARAAFALPQGATGVNDIEIVPFGPGVTTAINNETDGIPYRHLQVENIEHMGYFDVKGGYEAKGFTAGGDQSFNTLGTQHGPTVEVFEKHEAAEGGITKMPGVTAFMIESTQYPDMKVNPNWLAKRDHNYLNKFRTADTYFRSKTFDGRRSMSTQAVQTPRPLEAVTRRSGVNSHQMAMQSRRFLSLGRQGVNLLRKAIV